MPPYLRTPIQQTSSCSSRWSSFLLLLVLAIVSDVSPQRNSIFVSGFENSEDGAGGAEGAGEEEVEEEIKDPFGPTRIVVSRAGDPKVTIEYMLLTTDSVIQANRESMLPPVAFATGGLFTVRMVYEEEGWMSFGLSPSGLMVGGEVVIGIPSSATGTGTPYKYRMGSLDKTGILKLPSAQQTLIDARITQDQESGTTILEYSQLLNETGELAIVPGQQHTFIWAVGWGNRLDYHTARNSFTVPELLPGDVAPAPIMLGDATVPHQTIWMLHGCFALFAWGICAPVAVASAVLKAYLPKRPVGLWYKMHYYGNLACIVSTVIAVVLAVYATETKGTEHFAGTHELVGLLVFLIVGAQLLNGYFRPPAHQPPPKRQPHEEQEYSKDMEEQEEKEMSEQQEKTQLDDTMYREKKSSETGSDKTSEPETAAEAQLPLPHPHKKPLTRLLFEVGHRIIGVTLLVLGMVNIHTGLGLYAAWYMASTTQEKDTVWTVTTFWGYVGTFVCSVVLLKGRTIACKRQL